MRSREEIKNISDIRTAKVPTPEWAPPDKPPHECYVIVRSLAGEELDQFENDMIERKRKGVDVKLKDMRARLVALSCIDEAGDPLFHESDVEWLTKKSAAPLNRIYGKAQELSGMTDADLEEMEKNLERIPAEPSD